jgi:hypothetical protein
LLLRRRLLRRKSSGREHGKDDQRKASAGMSHL